MITVIIEKENEIASPRTVGTRTVLEQIGYVKLPTHKYPVRIKFTVPEGHSAPYKAGTYEVSPENFRLGKYEKLELNPFELILLPRA